MRANHAPLDLCSLIREPTEHAPDRPALVFPAQTLSFGALAARIDNCAGRLWELGVRPGSRIALLEPQHWDARLRNILGGTVAPVAEL